MPRSPEQPVRDQPQGPAGVAVAAGVGPDPVADLGHALFGVDAPRPHRADDAAGRDLDDREVRAGALAPALLAVLDRPARVALGVRLRDQVEPAGDLRLVAGLRDRRNVRGLPGAEGDDAVGERRVRRLEHRVQPTPTRSDQYDCDADAGETQEHPRTRMATPARGRRDQRRRSQAITELPGHVILRPRASSGGARHAQPLDGDALHGRDPRRRGRPRGGRAARRRHRPLHRPLAQGQVRRRRARLARSGSGGARSTSRRRGALRGLRNKVVELPRGPGSVRGRRLRGRRPGASDRRPGDHESRLPRAVRDDDVHRADRRRARATSSRRRSCCTRPRSRPTPRRTATRSGTFVALHPTRMEVLIGGTFYAGEIKKSIFSADERPAAARGRVPDALLGERRRRRRRRALLRPLRHRQDDALRRSGARADRRRRARLGRPAASSTSRAAATRR